MRDWGLRVEGWGGGGGWGRGQDLAHAARIRRAVGCDCDKSHAEGSTENTRRDEGRKGLGKRWSVFLAAFVGATGTCPVATARRECDHVARAQPIQSDARVAASESSAMPALPTAASSSAMAVGGSALGQRSRDGPLLHV